VLHDAIYGSQERLYDTDVNIVRHLYIEFLLIDYLFA
jgi:hypothetical protein